MGKRDTVLFQHFVFRFFPFPWLAPGFTFFSLSLPFPGHAGQGREKEGALVPVMMMGRNTIWGKRGGGGRGREHNVLVQFRASCCTNRNCNACDHGGYGANG